MEQLQQIPQKMRSARMREVGGEYHPEPAFADGAGRAESVAVHEAGDEVPRQVEEHADHHEGFVGTRGARRPTEGGRELGGGAVEAGAVEAQ